MRTLLRAASTESTGLPGRPSAAATRAAVQTQSSQKVTTASGAMPASASACSAAAASSSGSPVTGLCTQAAAIPSPGSAADQWPGSSTITSRAPSSLRRR
jgi:hypothetical protein